MSMENGFDRRMQIRRQARLSLLLVLLSAMAVFTLSYLSHWRLDLTEDKIFTLSDSTRTVLQGLDEPVLIRAYVTEGLPQPYGRMQRFLEDILNAYHDAGGGKVGFEMIDPASNPNIAASLTAMQIPKVQVQVVEDDQAQVKQGYLAVVIEYLDKKETIPVVQNEAGFEYMLTGKIRKLTGKGLVKVGLVNGFGAKSAAGLQAFTQLLSETYDVVDVDPLSKTGIPEDVRTLVVAGFNAPPSDAMRKKLAGWHAAGHGMLVLAGNARPDLARGFEVVPVDPYANDWLRDFGVAVEPGLVMDPHGSRVVVNQSNGAFRFRSVVDYPFLPRAEPSDNAHMMTRGLEGISLPFVAPLAWAGDVEAGRREVLLASSFDAAVQDGPPFNVNPLLSIKERFSGLSRRQSDLVLALSGDKGRLVAAGSVALLDNEFIENGALFILNMMDWLAGDEALIGLRSRGVTDRPIMNLASGPRLFWKGIWMFGLPLFVVIAGVWRWRLLRRRSEVA